MNVIGFVGDSGSGKTTLIECLLLRFCAAGLRVAAVKHAHHGFDMDRPGKDSYRFRAAGAGQVLIASERRWALLSEIAAPPGQAPAADDLAIHLAHLAPCDLVLVEGFRSQPGIPYIDVRRARLPVHEPAHEPAHESARAPPGGIVALATDAPAPGPAGPVPVLDLNDIDAVAAFIARLLGLPPC